MHLSQSMVRIEEHFFCGQNSRTSKKIGLLPFSVRDKAAHVELNPISRADFQSAEHELQTVVGCKHLSLLACWPQSSPLFARYFASF